MAFNTEDEETLQLWEATETVYGQFSPLHAAVLDRNLDWIKTALSEGVPVNSVNHNGETPLMTALKNFQEDAALLLLEAGADVNLPDQVGDTALHYLCRIEHPSPALKAALWRHQPTYIPNDQNEYPLHIVQNVLTALGLIQSGCPLSNPDIQRRTPLHRSCGNPALTRLLLDHGAPVTNGVLHQAVRTNSIEDVELVLRNGADPDYFDELAMTALHLAYDCGADESIKARLWEHTHPIHRIVVTKYDSSCVHRLYALWRKQGRTPRDLVKFFRNLCRSLKGCSYGDRVSYGKIVSAFCVHLLEDIGTREGNELIEAFTHFLKWPIFNFIMRTWDYRKTTSSFDLNIIFGTLAVFSRVHIDFSDLEISFYQFGDCELLRRILHFQLGNKVRKFEDIPIFVRILYDISIDVVSTLKQLHVSNFSLLHLFCVHNIARFYTLPASLRLRFNDTYHNIRHFHRPPLDFAAMERSVEVINRIPLVPSLLELSRNASRIMLANFYGAKNSHRLIQVLKQQNAPLEISRILLLETPMHPNVIRPDYYPCVRNLYPV